MKVIIFITLWLVGCVSCINIYATEDSQHGYYHQFLGISTNPNCDVLAKTILKKPFVCENKVQIVELSISADEENLNFSLTFSNHYDAGTNCTSATTVVPYNVISFMDNGIHSGDKNTTLSAVDFLCSMLTYKAKFY